MLDKIYNMSIRRAMLKYLNAWGEILNQEEMDRLGLWLAGKGGPMGIPPSGLVEKLHANPTVARKVFEYQKLVLGTKALFRK